ncbi:hypothetical protein Snas_3555 [Stackebrandtia nassauensis DSM 44728]|uniref:Uncharacterized protein n=2 Tax=Stackebrandtia TaxID=283810 RepID=D3PWJ5_STANL|nr:hypothetical protein Snas_3555 [Stackebrandtia nassauensis DSM 44728]
MLERRFRRLLRVYPAWYRRVRGEEMLTTLMDAAQGRHRPSASERLDVVFGGMRKQLSSGSVSAAVAGVFVALFVATLGAIGGAVAGWHTAADLPDDAAADRIARQTIPDMDDVKTYKDRSLFGWVEEHGDLYDTRYITNRENDEFAGHMVYQMEHKANDYARLHGVKERLEAAGWNVRLVRKDSTSVEFTATRDGIDLWGYTSHGPSHPRISTIDITRATPTPVPVLTVTGLIIGALLGWTVTNRLARRISHGPTGRRVVTSALLGIGSCLLALPTAINVYFVAASLALPREPVPIWLAYTTAPESQVALLGTAALALALLCAALPIPTHRLTQSNPTTAT